MVNLPGMGVVNAVAGNVLDAAGMARTWNTGLCDCCSNTGNCLDVYFCFSCSAARMCNAIDGDQDKNDCGLCFAIMILQYNTGVGTPAMILRYRIVAKYNIRDEGVIGTFCNAMCCPLCSMCQTWRMLTDMNLWPGGTCCGTTNPNGIGIAMK